MVCVYGLWRTRFIVCPLNKDLMQLLSNLGISAQEADILVDLKVTTDASIKLRDICGRLPSLLAWRTFTVASGAFPEDLVDLAKNQQHKLMREDWLSWSSQNKRRPTLPRRPSFGDYTIQFPHYKKPVDFANPSASIRYTSESYWVIMRGEQLHGADSPGHAQYWANARLLCNREEFCGADYSKGDEYIYDKSQPTKNPGTPQTWLRAGINHHLTFVINQIASSFGTSTGGVSGPGSGRVPPPRQASRTLWREASDGRLQPRQVPLVE